VLSNRADNIIFVTKLELGNDGKNNLI